MTIGSVCSHFCSVSIICLTIQLFEMMNGNFFFFLKKSLTFSQFLKYLCEMDFDRAFIYVEQEEEEIEINNCTQIERWWF